MHTHRETEREREAETEKETERMSGWISKPGLIFGLNYSTRITFSFFAVTQSRPNSIMIIKVKLIWKNSHKTKCEFALRTAMYKSGSWIKKAYKETIQLKI